MPVKIPVSLVPRAYVDFDMEQHQMLRHDYVLPDGLRIPPLSAGRLMALELIASEFFLHPESCAQLDIAAALVLLTCRRHLVEEFTRKSPSADAAGLNMFPELQKAAASFWQAHADAILADYPALVRWCLEVPFYGYDMIPKSGGAVPKECWFDGEFAGSVLAQASKVLATPYEMTLWDTPLCVVWHAVAQHAAAFGVKHVERPPDQAVLKEMMAEAAAREKRGELHPWQFDDPVGYGLTDAQANANPALIGLFARMRADFERGGRKPLDPADYPLPSPPHAGGAAGAGTCTITVAGSFRSADGPADSTAENTDTREACITVSNAARIADFCGAGACACGLRGPSAISVYPE